MPDDPSTSAQEAAVDAMTEAARGHVGHFDNGDVRWVCECAEASGHDLDSYVRHVNQVALTALLSPTKKPCAQCGGKGWWWRTDRPDDGRVDCPDCIDGFVSSPAPIEGLLEQVGWRVLPKVGKPYLTDGTTLGGERGLERVFRLPSKVREG